MPEHLQLAAAHAMAERNCDEKMGRVVESVPPEPRISNQDAHPAPAPDPMPPDPAPVAPSGPLESLRSEFAPLPRPMILHTS